MTSKNRTRHSGRECLYLLVATLPTLLLLSLFVSDWLRGRAAAATVQTTLDLMTSNGDPIDIPTLAQSFEKQTSKQHSIQWREVKSAVLALENRYWDVIGETVDGMDRLVAPGDPWDAKPTLSRHVKEAMPIIQSIESLLRNDERVWQPIIFQGYETLLPDLQNSRSVVRLLGWEFRVAVHEGDRKRAMRALELIVRVSNAFDWHICLVSDLVWNAHLQSHRALIRQSLAFDFWTLTDLVQLDRQLADIEDLDARWSETIAMEMAMMDYAPAFGRYSAFNTQVMSPPVARLRSLKQIQRIRNVKGVGSSQHRRQIANGENTGDDPQNTLEGFSITDIPFANVFNDREAANRFTRYAVASLRFTQNQRWTRTAVAIKKFRIQEGRWPERLSELSQVGLAESNWKASDSKDFGYRIRKDGSEVILWTTSNWDGEIGVAPPREETDHDPQKLLEIETVIGHRNSANPTKDGDG